MWLGAYASMTSAATPPNAYTNSGSKLSIVSIKPRGSGNTDFVVVEDSAPTRFREAKDAPWQKLDGGRTRHILELKNDKGSWVMVRSAELAG